MMRVPTLERMALFTGESRVAYEHYSRMLNEAIEPYCTRLVRGAREHVGLNWMSSTFLASLIGDPRHAASKIVTYGGLRHFRVSLETQEVRGPFLSDLSSLGEPTLKTSFETPGDYDSPLEQSSTLFGDFTGYINAIARDWNGWTHQLVNRGFKLQITIGDEPKASISELWAAKDGICTWRHHLYALPMEDSSSRRSVFALPVLRQVSIEGHHILMLASLWRDTLVHWGEISSTPEPPPAEGGQDPAVSANNRKAGELPTPPAPDDDQPVNTQQAAPLNTGQATPLHTQIASVEACLRVGSSQSTNAEARCNERDYTTGKPRRAAA